MRAFLRFAATYEEFVALAGASPNFRRIANQLLTFVREAGVFLKSPTPSPANALPDPEDEDPAALRTFGESESTVPRDAIGPEEIDDLQARIVGELWWSTTLREGPEVRQFFDEAFALHKCLVVYDPYFCSTSGDGGAGAKWLIAQCIRRGMRTLEINCRENDEGSSKQLIISYLREAFSQSLETGRSDVPLETKLRVFSKKAGLHDRCLVFSNCSAANAWRAAFVVGTGVSAFQNEPFRRTLVARTHPQNALDLVRRDARPKVVHSFRLASLPQPQIQVWVDGQSSGVELV